MANKEVLELVRKRKVKKVKVMLKKIAVGVILIVVGCLFLSAIGSSLPSDKPVEQVVVGITETPLPTEVLTETVTPTLEPTNTPDPSIDNPTLAAMWCEDFVLDQLKSPASAKFPGLFDEWPKIMPLFGDTTGHDWHVVSYVDAQNTYGALIRNFYTCQISYVGNDRWNLIDLWFHK